MPFQREAEVVLAIWREAERRLNAVAEGSQEADELQAEVLLLRNEYNRLIDLAIEHHRAVPPPLPDEA